LNCEAGKDFATVMGGTFTNGGFAKPSLDRPSMASHTGAPETERSIQLNIQINGLGTIGQVSDSTTIDGSTAVHDKHLLTDANRSSALPIAR